MKYEDMSGLGIVLIRKLVPLWNINRHEMFMIYEPEKNGLFFGVIKIFYYDSDNCVMSKCIRISSIMTVNDVLKILLEKIQWNKNAERYSFYTAYSSGEFTLFSRSNIVLLEQLRWVQNGIEGRFLVTLDTCIKKKKIFGMKKGQKGTKVNSNTTSSSNESLASNKDAVAKQVSDLFKLVPDGPLVSSIANQNEALSQKGQQKINRKIEELMQQENTLGVKEEFVCTKEKPKIGTLRIFGSSIFPEAAYKTIIVSICDDVRTVIREALIKYNYCGSDIDENTCYLAMIITEDNTDKKKHKLLKAMQREYYILDEDRPLLLQYNFNPEAGKISFHLRRKVSFESGRTSTISREAREATTAQRFCAIFCELSSYTLPKPIDHPVYISLLRDVIAIGSNIFSVKDANFMGQKPTQTLVLKHRSIHPIHCIISNISGLLSITPSVMDADVTVDGARIYETTVLTHGNRISIGSVYCFELHIPIKTTDTMPPSHWKKQFEMKKKAAEALKTSEKLIEKIYEDDKFISLPLQMKFKSEDFCKIFEKIAYLLHNDNLRFKLSLSFIMYMAIVGQFENNFKTSNPSDKSSETSSFDYQKFQEDCEEAIKILDEKMIYYSQDLPHLFLWLANFSEFMHFIRKDKAISPLAESLQIFCDRCIQNIMNQINNRIESQLKHLISAFFIPLTDTEDIAEDMEKQMNFNPAVPADNFDMDEKNIDIFQVENNSTPKTFHCEYLLATNIKPRLYDIIVCFNEWLRLFCQFNVNPILTGITFLKLFSCMFTKLVQLLIKPPVIEKEIFTIMKEALKARVAILKYWAEYHGVEISFVKHSKPLLNVIEFINAPKETFEQLKDATIACQALNGLQMCTLLKNWSSASGFEHVTLEWIDSIGKFIVESKGYFDEDITQHRLTYTQTFYQHYAQIEDGFFSENESNISPILYNTIKSLLITEDLELIKSNKNTSRWNIRFCDQRNFENIEDIKAEYLFITIKKLDETPLGMKIVSIKDSVTKNTGIFVSQIYPNTLIHKDGRLHVGDQLMAINGCTLIGIDENRAANVIYECGAVLKFEVLKNSAKLHGLEIPKIDSLKYTELNNPSTNQKRKDLNHQLSEIVISTQPLRDAFDTNTQVWRSFEKNDNELKSIPENFFPQKPTNMVLDKCLKQLYPNDVMSLGMTSSTSLEKVEYNPVAKKLTLENNKIPFEVIKSTDGLLGSYKSSTSEIDMPANDENLQIGILSRDSSPNSIESTKCDNDMILPPRPPLPENYQVPALKKEYC